MLSVHSCPLGKLGGKDTGGMSVYIRELARQLGRQGHSVDVYTRIHEPIHDEIVELGENTRLIHLKAGAKKETDKLVIYSHLADFACDLENFRRRNGLQYDLIHSHYWLSGWVGKWIQQRWNLPHITVFHTLGAVKNATGIGEDEPELRINAEKELVKDCHRIIVSAEMEKEDLIDYYDASPETISVIPCGVNLDLFRPINKEIARCHLGLNGGAIILFVGRIVPLKGIDQLLMAMTHLKRDRRTELLLIGGDEHSRVEVERLKSLSRSLRICDSVTFLGAVRQEMLPFFYSAADLCVVSSYYESFGLVALESLACGTPVVATKVGGMESVIRQGETGYIVRDNTPRHFADKIALLLSTPNGKRGLIGSIRASVTRFSWANVALAMVNEYQGAFRDYFTKVC